MTSDRMREFCDGALSRFIDDINEIKNAGGYTVREGQILDELISCCAKATEGIQESQ